MDGEPTENIGSDSGTEMGSEPATADSRAGRVVDRLGGLDASDCVITVVSMAVALEWV